jgi:hypothetical protein
MPPEPKDARIPYDRESDMLTIQFSRNESLTGCQYNSDSASADMILKAGYGEVEFCPARRQTFPYPGTEGLPVIRAQAKGQEKQVQRFIHTEAPEDMRGSQQ